MSAEKGTAASDSGIRPAPGVPSPKVATVPLSLDVKGREVRGHLYVPDVIAPALVPVLVIAPGQGYHMDLPLTRGLFDRIATEGWITLRFDWSFHTQKREPSPAYALEVEELQAAIDHARELPQADRSRLYIAGKSLGAGIALERAAQDPSIRGCLLLTPPIHSPKPEYKMGTIRPRLEKLRQPSLIVVGERDPLCELGRLYALVQGLLHPPHIAVVGGDHSLRPATEQDSASANVGLALHHCVDWLRRHCTR